MLCHREGMNRFRFNKGDHSTFSFGMIKVIPPRFVTLKTNIHKGFRNYGKRASKVTSSAKEGLGKNNVFIEIAKQCSDRVTQRLLI